MTDMNISGVGPNSAIKQAAEIASESLKKLDEKVGSSKKQPVSDENEQVAVECEASDELDSGWMKIQERRQEIFEKMQEQEEELLDINKERLDLANKTAGIVINNTQSKEESSGWMKIQERRQELLEKKIDIMKDAMSKLETE